MAFQVFASVLLCLVLAPAVNGAAPVNIALGRPTLQSSIAWGGDSARAVDGNLDPVYSNASCTHTDMQNSPYWAVDLGESYLVTSVTITNRQDCCSERLSNYNIVVTDTPPSGGSQVYGPENLCAYREASHLGSLNIKCSKPRSGRYVMIQLKDVQYLTLCEVQVFANEGVRTGIQISCNKNSDCPFFLANSRCKAGFCECEQGFFMSDGGYYCAKVKIGTPCVSGNDSFCAAGVAGAICDARYGICRCPDGYGNVVHNGVGVCAAAVSSPECADCIATGGTCIDQNSDGTPDECGCPECFSSSTGNSLATGCDKKQVPTGAACSPNDGEVECGDPHAECRYNNDLSYNYYCQCKLGYVAIPRPYDPSHADCKEVTNKVMDQTCRTCESNGGICYTNNTDTTMDGCLCPLTRSSSSSDPANACDTNHFQMNCSTQYPTLCFQPATSPHHNYLFNQLVAGKAIIYMSDYIDDAFCRFKQQENQFCIDERIVASKACGVELKDSTQRTSYSGFVMVQHNAKFCSTNDILLNAYCTYDKFAKVSTGEVVVAARLEVASEGVNVRPEVALIAVDKFGANAEVAGITLGSDIRLKIQITDDKGIYKNLRAEVCIVSDRPSLKLSETQAVTFIMNNCPVPNSFLSRGTNFFPVFGDLKTIQTGFFTVPKFTNADYVFFHCAIRVCIDEANCEPENCNTAGSGRNKRSAAATKLPRTMHELTTVAVFKRSPASMYDMNKALESPELARQTIGIKIQTPESLPPHYEQNEQFEKPELYGKQTYMQKPIVYPEGYGDDAFYRSGYESSQQERESTMIMIISVLGSSLATLIIAAFIFFMCFVLSKNPDALAKDKQKQSEMS